MFEGKEPAHDDLAVEARGGALSDGLKVVPHLEKDGVDPRAVDASLGHGALSFDFE